MQIIKTLSEMVEDEIGDIKKYAMFANELKDDYPQFAEIVYNISKQESEHMNKLHEIVVKMITTYRAEKGEPPADMLAVYNYLHKKHIEEYADAKRVQDIYLGK